jgi:DNA-binding transcriptional ArsR family regulator
MQTVYLTPADITRTRFATDPLPLLESSLALAEHRVGGPSGRPDLVPGPAQLLLRSAVRPLLNLTMGQVGPTFLDPLVADAEEGLELLRATPPAVMRSELRRVLQAHSSAVPTWVHNLAEGYREERELVETAVRACHDLFVAPLRVQYEQAFRQDIATRLPDLCHGGIASVLTKLHPQIRFRDDAVVEFPHPRDQEMRLHGQGIELMPSAAWRGAPMLTFTHNQPGRLLLIYPLALNTAITTRSGNDGLARLLGGTRAAVLRQLRVSATTGMLAARLRISAASVSEHTAVLRDAGLVDSRRTGRSVHHMLTQLGHALLSSNPASSDRTHGSVDHVRG